MTLAAYHVSLLDTQRQLAYTADFFPDLLRRRKNHPVAVSIMPAMLKLRSDLRASLKLLSYIGSSVPTFRDNITVPF